MQADQHYIPPKQPSSTARGAANRATLCKRIHKINTVDAVFGARQEGRPRQSRAGMRRSRAGMRSDVPVPAVLERANALLDPDDRHTAEELVAMVAFLKSHRVARSWKLQYLQRRDWMESGVSWGLRCAVVRVLTSVEANAPEIEGDAKCCSHLLLSAERPLTGAGDNAVAASIHAQQHLGGDNSVSPAAYNMSSTESTKSPLSSVKTELVQPGGVVPDATLTAAPMRGATPGLAAPKLDGREGAEEEARKTCEALPATRTQANPMMVKRERPIIHCNPGDADIQQNAEIRHREDADQMMTLNTEALQNKQFPTDGSKYVQMEARQESDQLHDCKAGASLGQLAPGCRRFKWKEQLPDTSDTSAKIQARSDDQEIITGCEPLTPDWGCEVDNGESWELFTDCQKQPSSPLLTVSASYMYQRGKPGKVSDCEYKCALPCDDAMAATENVVVICDGVTAGGAASGELARCISQAVIKAANAVPPCKSAKEIVFTACSDERVVELLCGSMGGTTTLTVLKLQHQETLDGNISKVQHFIEAIEIGDSQWALMRQDASNKWKCVYLSEPRMFPGDRAPLQLGFGRSCEDFFDGVREGSRVRSWVNVEVGEDGRCRDLIIAGSDGLWDNLNDGNGIVTDNSAKAQKLSEFVNRQWKYFSEQHARHAVAVAPFVDFLGKCLKDAATTRMSGPHFSSMSGLRTCKSDDVSIYVGSLGHISEKNEEHHQVPGCQRLPNEWLFADSSVNPVKLSAGVELTSSTTRQLLQSFLSRPAPAVCAVDRFEGYRVNICHAFRDTGACKFGGNCIHAHGRAQLRCRFWTRDTCSKGENCQLLHDTEDPTAATRALNLFSACKKRKRAFSPPSDDAPAETCKRQRAHSRGPVLTF